MSPRITYRTAACALAAQAAVEAYTAVHPAYAGSIGVLLWDTVYDAADGVVIEHEGFLLPEATKAAQAAVAAQGLCLETGRWQYAWAVLDPQPSTHTNGARDEDHQDIR